MLMLTGVRGYGQNAPLPPAEYQDLYSSLQTQISTFDQTVLQSWNRTKGPVVFSSHLGSANSAKGTVLLSSDRYAGVLLEMDLLKALGVKGLILSIDYPALDPAFDPYGGQAANYLAFYQQVVGDIRARGMKVIIETGPLFSDPAFSNVNVMPFYNAISTAQYNLGRARQAVLIAQQLKPDYLSVIEEPDTEADQTGKPEMGTVEGSTALLNQILAVYRRSGTTVPVGAGVGSWIPSYDQYIQSFVTTSIDYVDIHLYPVNRDYLTRALNIADMAKTAGKKVAMSECWLQKIRDSELGNLSTAAVFARDNFSFWSPLDTQFLEAMVHFSYYKNLAFAGAFWESYFFGYVPYNATTANMSIPDLNAAALDLQTKNMGVGIYSSTGYNWKDSILRAPDQTPPIPPTLTASEVYPTSALLTWTKAPDNVGTAGYRIYRNGGLLATQSGLSYYDQGLKDGKTYKYTALAFDASGNVSSLAASVPVTTPDITPPGRPSRFNVTLASTSQVNLSWAASTDNVGVQQYAIFRGKGGEPPTGFATSATTSYQNTNLESAYTYCYYVVAQDERMLTSAPTPTLCVATPDTLAPSMPSNLTGTALSNRQVSLSWTASTDNVAVTGYEVQRTVGVLTTTVGTVTGTSFKDSTVLPNTLYTYKVLAKDAAGNKSRLSIGAWILTPK